MKFLFDGKYAPLTDGIAFIDAPIDKVAEGAVKWAEKTNYEPVFHKIIEVKTNFEDALSKALPFIYPAKRIFFETRGKWTGYIENDLRTESYHADVIASYAGGNSVVGGEAWFSNYGRRVNGWGGGTFYYYYKGELKRHLMLSDQDRWEFNQYGEPLPFEDTEKYKERFARNRFTPEMLDKYLKNFGIEFFNEDFYMPPGSKAFIVERVRPPYPNEVPMTLEERRKGLRYI